MEALHGQRLDRAFSSGEASCCGIPSSKTPIRRLHSLPAESRIVTTPAISRAGSAVVSTSSTLHREASDSIYEPEAELLTDPESQDSLSREFRAQVANLQQLERVKGELHQAMLDLPDPDAPDGDWRAEDGFSEEDWTVLRAATLQHQAEQSRLQYEEAKKLEERKKERALKRAARKAKAEMTDVTHSAELSTPFAAANASPLSRKSLPATSSGARAIARSRSRANSKWGRAAEPVSPNEGNYTSTEWKGSLGAMASISAHRLLTHEEEVQLSKKVQDFIKLETAFRELSEKLGRDPHVSEWASSFGQEEHSFLARLEDGSEARTRMLTCNQRLVVSIARRFQGKGLEMMDLVQEGMVGLLRGVEKFDASRGFKFSTYATWWIRQSISRSISELSRMIRLPAHLNELLSKVARAEREFQLKHFRHPTDEELSRVLELPASRIRMIKQTAQAPKSLDETLKQSQANDSQATTVGEMIEDQGLDDMELQMVTNSMHRDVNAVLSTLSPREHGIIRMRYGLDDGQPKTLEEIGVAFHVTRERIRQIENKALSNLKNPLRNSSLNTYVDGEALSLLQDAGWKPGINRDSSN